MTHRCVFREPLADIHRVVSQEPAHSEGVGPGALVAPLVQRVDRYSEELGDLFDGTRVPPCRLLGSGRGRGGGRVLQRDGPSVIAPLNVGRCVIVSSKSPRLRAAPLARIFRVAVVERRGGVGSVVYG